MNKIRKLIMSFVLFVMSISVCTSCCNVSQNVQVRTGNCSIETSNYFDSIEDSNNTVEYKTIAKKKISSKSLEGYESVVFQEGEYIITYEVTTNLEDRTVVLNVHFDSTNEPIIENFTGIPMINYLDEEDILFTIDDSHIFLSELNDLNEQEQCSWFGNILHKTLNASMIALSYIEPAIKILVYTSDNVLHLLYSMVKNTSYLTNYVINANKTQPTGFVYGQNSYSDWNFGFSNMSYAGCEVIAGYNLAHAKGRDYTLADTIALYECLGIEIGAAQGFFGSNPYQISYFLNAAGISYNKVINYKEFNRLMNNDKNYYVILSRWNGENSNDQIHTFMIDKDSNYGNYKYHAYNFDGWKTDSSTNESDYTKYFRGQINKTYICAYFIFK